MILRTIINCNTDLFRYCVGLSFALHCAALALWPEAEQTLEPIHIPKTRIESHFVAVAPLPKLEAAPEVAPQAAVPAKVESKSKSKRSRRTLAKARRAKARRAKARRVKARRAKARRAKARQLKQKTKALSAQNTPKKLSRPRVTPQVVDPSPTVAVQAREGSATAMTSKRAQPTEQREESRSARGVASSTSVTKRLSRRQIRGILKGYYRSLDALMRRERNYPRSARRLGLEGTVLVEMVVNRSGQIIQVKIARSSGHQALDQAALAQVQKMRQVPEIPSVIKRTKMTFQIPFEYRLQS